MSSMKTFWSFLRPSFVKTTLWVILILASLFVTSGFEPTSKLTWHANRGFPLPFITIFEYVFRGLCMPDTICIATNIRDFYPDAMLLDLLGWYLVSCTMVFAYRIAKKRDKGISNP
jgi:hypothetical protein